MIQFFVQKSINWNHFRHKKFRKVQLFRASHNMNVILTFHWALLLLVHKNSCTEDSKRKKTVWSVALVLTTHPPVETKRWTELVFSSKQSFKAPLLYTRHPDLSQIENVRKINPGRREARAIDFHISNVSGLAEFLCYSACLWGRRVAPACCQPVYFPSFTPNTKDPRRCCW